MNLDVVAAGVGGQGVLTLGSLLTRAALREGFDAHSTALAGLARLGDGVLVHVRIGTPAGPSPKVPRAGAHVVVGLERLEALRLAPYLAPAGTALLSDEAIRPYEARFRREAYPEPGQVEAAFAGHRVVWDPAGEFARRHGPQGLTSAVMLGALAGITRVVERDNLVLALREARPDIADAEAEAFFEGYRFVTGRDD